VSSLSGNTSRTLDQDKIFAAATSAVPDEILKHPGMISETERRALYNLVLAHHRDGETIIDAGAFLGASTKAFLLALKRTGFKTTSIHTYEYGKFSKYSADFASKALDRVCGDGDRFEELLVSLVDDRDGLVKFHLGDIKDFAFSGPDISIAFIDVLKSTSLLDAVYDKFFPYFTTKTVLYQQDYFHPFHPWIACSMALHRDSLAYIGRPDPEFGAYNAAVFEIKDPSRLRSAIPSRLKDATKDQVLDLINTAIAMHEHPFEKLNVIGLRAAAVAIFDKDKTAALEDFVKSLNDNGIGDLLEHSRQQHHVNRIKRYIDVFASNPMIWSD
jgi:hypothetical protein